MSHALIKKGLLLLLCSCAAVSGACHTFYGSAEPVTEALSEAAVPVLETDVSEINKYGSLILNIKGSSMLNQGYEYGDIISVTINGETLEMPVVSSYTDVDNGAMLCRVVCDAEKDQVLVGINMSNLAEQLGIAVKSEISEDPGYRWDMLVDEPISVSLAVKEKGGYAEEYLIHQLTRTNERADYPNLTDEEYANFRNIATTGMGKDILYRSSNPVNPELNRNKEADEALNNAAIRTILNLADTETIMSGYEDFGYSYYSQRDIIALNMGVDFTADEFKTKLASGMEFLASHEGPYLIHCNEGKDRAGFVAALLECLMGAGADEVVSDYMVTYYNYYGVEPGTDQYEAIASGNIVKTLQTVFNTEDIWNTDLAADAEAYLLSAGISAETIQAVKDNLNG